MTEPTPAETRRLLTLVAILCLTLAVQAAVRFWGVPGWVGWLAMVGGGMGLVWVGQDRIKDR